MTKQFINNGRCAFFQLAGHSCFRAGLRPDTILKESTGNEGECLRKIQQDPELVNFAPKVFGTVELDDETYLEMQDLLAGFRDPSVMDIKMGYRTCRKKKGYMALCESSELRPDLFDKMIEVDINEPTPEERRLRAITKPRYMSWRESISSTAKLGFRIEGMRLMDGTIDRDFKTTKDEEQVVKALVRFTKGFPTRLKYLQRLYDIRRALSQSMFFSTHELIGSSLLFIHDDESANIWLIDFAKTDSLPDYTPPLDGYMAGVDNLIRLFESITVPSSATQQTASPRLNTTTITSTITMPTSRKNGQIHAGCTEVSASI